MRLWSIDPGYLDTKGLLAVWREGLLAKKVLEGRTRGYTKHPQLVRFRNCGTPLLAIDSFLYYVLTEARIRGYRFDESKIGGGKRLVCYIPVTEGQVAYELARLLGKLEMRDPSMRDRLAEATASGTGRPGLNKLFYLVPGPVEPWEKTVLPLK